MTGFIVFVLMSAAIWAALGCLTLPLAVGVSTTGVGASRLPNSHADRNEPAPDHSPGPGRSGAFPTRHHPGFHMGVPVLFTALAETWPAVRRPA